MPPAPPVLDEEEEALAPPVLVDVELLPAPPTPPEPKGPPVLDEALVELAPPVGARRGSNSLPQATRANGNMRANERMLVSSRAVAWRRTGEGYRSPTSSLEPDPDTNQVSSGAQRRSTIVVGSCHCSGATWALAKSPEAGREALLERGVLGEANTPDHPRHLIGGALVDTESR